MPMLYAAGMMSSWMLTFGLLDFSEEEQALLEEIGRKKAELQREIQVCALDSIFFLAICRTVLVFYVTGIVIMMISRMIIEFFLACAFS